MILVKEFRNTYISNINVYLTEKVGENLGIFSKKGYLERVLIRKVKKMQLKSEIY